MNRAEHNVEPVEIARMQSARFVFAKPIELTAQKHVDIVAFLLLPHSVNIGLKPLCRHGGALRGVELIGNRIMLRRRHMGNARIDRRLHHVVERIFGMIAER